MSERWKDIPGHYGYQASTEGRIRSYLSRRRTRSDDGVLRPHYDKYGYGRVALRVNGRNTSRPVHGLVCAAFHGPRPPGHDVDHRDRDPRNNTPENLRWLTRRHHRARHRILARQHELPAARAIITGYNRGKSLTELCKEHGIAYRRLIDLARSGLPLPELAFDLPLEEPRTAITPATEAVIKKRLANGETGRKLAGEYGVDEATISRIRSGHRTVRIAVKATGLREQAQKEEHGT